MQADELTGKGHLKIFLGYAVGVGKRAAMLHAARKALGSGLDVLHADEHADPAIPSLPRFDLDAVLERRPALVVVDQLALANLPGSRHAHRYQDVLELLGAGLDVYTTLDIGHLESLNDVVAQITGTRVRETVPDHVLERADSVVLVDLPPEDLLTGPLRVAPELAHFYRPGNLKALRELALRRAADHVDEDLRGYMRQRAIPGPWAVRQRLLVAVGPSPFSERLVRSTRRLAEAQHAHWTALSVDVGEKADLTGEERARVGRHLRLAHSLGAQTAQVNGLSVAEAVLAYAREHNVTTIVAGRPPQRAWWHRDLVDELMRGSGTIDVLVVSAQEHPDSVVAPAPARSGLGYLGAAGTVALAGVLCEPLSNWLQPANLVMVFLAAVVSTGYLWGRGPSTLASVLSVLLYDFFYVPPYLTFDVADKQYLVTFLGLLVVGWVVSTLTSRAQDQARAANRREEETVALYDLGRDLADSRDAGEIRRVVELHTARHTRTRTWLLLPALEGPGLELGGVPLEASQQAVADWTFRHGQEAGLGTQTLPDSTILALPVRTEQRTIGVLCLAGEPSSGGRTLLQAMLSQAALALERARLVTAERQAELLKASESLQTALLNSVSHDLRIPLVSITGALSALSEEGVYQDPETRRSLLDNALSEADRLNRLVSNLLSLTRLESGTVELNRVPCDIQDLISTTLPVLPLPEVDLALDPDLPLVPADFVLIQQVLINLLDNAVKYSPPGSPLEVGARQNGDFVEIWVADRGPGVPAEEPIFEKFHRAPGTRVTGSGLGLSICRGLVEAHGGSIAVEAREGGGSVFRFRLPLR